MSDYGLLLHGAGSTADFMVRRFPTALLGVPAVVAPQQRGGEAQYCQALSKLVQRLGPPALICGVSLGAHLACALATQWAPRRLVLVLPAAIAAYERPANNAPAGTEPSQPTQPSLQERRAAIADLRPDWVQREVLRAWSLIDDAAVEQSLDAGARSSGPSAALLQSLMVPAAVIAVADDPLHPLPVAQAWSRALPDATLHVVASRSDVDIDPWALARPLA